MPSLSLRVIQPSFLKKYPLNKGFGHLKILDFISIIEFFDLDINPRKSKKTLITNKIVKSLENSQSIFAFKSRGILICCEKISIRDDLITIIFDKDSLNGILDGGHTTFAIGIFLLRKLNFSERIISQISTWDSLHAFWNENIEEIKEKSKKIDPEVDSILIPIEIIYPNSIMSNHFRDLILEISEARNTNAQLKIETIKNQSGIFAPLKRSLDKETSKKIQWKTNGEGYIDVKYLLSISWIILSELPYFPPAITPLPGPTAYSSKQAGLTRYISLIENNLFARKANDEYYILDLKNEISLYLINDLLEAHDYLLTHFDELLAIVDLNIEQLSAIKLGDPSKELFTGLFDDKKCNYIIPRGFIFPILYSFGGLVRHSGTLEWVITPIEFLKDKNLTTPLMKTFKSTLQLSNFDPQKVGKNKFSYLTIKDTLERNKTSNLIDSKYINNSPLQRITKNENL